MNFRPVLNCDKNFIPDICFYIYKMVYVSFRINGSMWLHTGFKYVQKDEFLVNYKSVEELIMSIQSLMYLHSFKKKLAF